MASQDNRPPSRPATAQQKTHWRTVSRRLNSDLLFAEDILGRTPLVVEIVDSGEVKPKGDDGRLMTWVSFKGGRKKLGCNATNCKVLETIFGSGYHQDWRGKITLVTVKTSYKDRKSGLRIETDAVRVAPEPPRNREAVDAGAHELPPPVEPAPLTAEEQAEIARIEQEAGR